jgi:hypothetical protein
MIYIVGLFLMWATTCLAQEADWKIASKGSVDLKTSVYRLPDPDRTRHEDFNNRLRTDFESRLTWRDNFQLIGSVRAFANLYPSFQESWVELNDTYLRYRRSSLRLTLGRQTFSWGVTSVFSPTDILNPLNLKDPVDPIKRSVLAGMIAYSSTSWILEFYWLPLFRPSLAPDLRSRFFPSLPREVQNPLGMPATLTPVYHIDESFVPPTSRIQSQWALKSRSSFRNLDMSFLLFSGFQTYPSYSAQSGLPDTTKGTIPINILPVYPKGQFAGITLETQGYGFILKGEGAYWNLQSPPKPIGYLQDPYGVFILALERKLPGLNSQDTCQVTLQYAKEIRKRSDQPNPVVLPFYRSFQSSLLPVINYDAGPFVRFTLLGAYNFIGGDYFISGIFSYQVSDTITLSLRVDNFGGSSNGPFGRFNQNDRLTTGFKWDF